MIVKAKLPEILCPTTKGEGIKSLLELLHKPG